MTSPPSSSRASALVAHVVEQMAEFGPVQARAMFGGFGLYAQGLMFALMADGDLYFKADAQSEGRFVSLGLQPFTYEAKGRVATLRYYRAPAEVFDDRAAMARWARLAFDCAWRNRKPQGAHRRRTAASGPAPALAQAPAEANALQALDNLGPKSVEMLAKAGITTLAQLRELGSVRAYVRTKARCPRASLNLLWALEGALSGRPWQEVADQDRASLLMALEDAARAG